MIREAIELIEEETVQEYIENEQNYLEDGEVYSTIDYEGEEFELHIIFDAHVKTISAGYAGDYNRAPEKPEYEIEIHRMLINYADIENKELKLKLKDYEIKK